MSFIADHGVGGAAIAAVVIGVAAGSLDAGQQVSLPAVVDTTVRSSGASCNACCGDPTTVVGRYEGELWWSLMRWDITGSIEPGSTIVGVELEMRQDGSPQTPNPVLSEIRPILAGPNGGDGEWDECEPTYFNMVGSYGTFGSTLGYAIPGLTGGTRWLTFPDQSNRLRDWAQDVVDGEIQDSGLLMRTQNAGGADDFVRFLSVQGGSPARLVIEYEPPAGEADFRVSQVSGPDGPLWRGDSFPATVCVENIGDAASDGSVLADLSLASSTSGFGTRIGLRSNHSFGSLTDGEEECDGFSFAVPQTSLVVDGTWYLCVEITTGDSDGSNNVAYSGPIEIAEPVPADLVLMSGSLDGSVYGPGDAFGGSAVVSNAGDLPSTFFGIEAEFSGPGSCDVQVLGVSQQLGGGASGTFPLTGSICGGMPAGEYDVTLRLDAFGDPSGGNTISVGSVTIEADGPCNDADLVEPFGVHDLSDISAFVTAFGVQDDAVDYDGNGVWDLDDIVVFITAFEAGCP